MKYIEANQVPEGSTISPNIFGLPCVSTAYKNAQGDITYLVDGCVARSGDWIVKYEDGTWGVMEKFKVETDIQLKRIQP